MSDVAVCAEESVGRVADARVFRKMWWLLDRASMSEVSIIQVGSVGKVAVMAWTATWVLLQAGLWLL